ncbi:hypothetical protein HanIR_Chr04g0205131 [Helianthus annuus]|nr:hypothetical protein HanIR_Chr04g0205131 [Helianthus annuus]
MFSIAVKRVSYISQKREHDEPRHLTFGQNLILIMEDIKDNKSDERACKLV